MNKFFVAAVTVAAFCGAPALAADIPTKAPIHKAVDPTNSWTGFYLGVNAGLMSNEVDGYETLFPVRAWNTTQNTGIGGIHGGFQYQLRNVVIGLEGGWSAQLGNAFGSKVGGGIGASCGLDSPRACQSRIVDILQFGPRLGWVMERWMVYATGGYARAKIDTKTFDPTSAFAVTQADNHHSGWFAGGGLEYLVTNNIILGVDYKHYKFRSQDYIDSVFTDFNRTLTASVDTVTARLTFKTGN